MNVGEVFSVEAYARFVALRDSVLPSRGVLDLARGWRPRPSRWGRGRRGTRCDLNYLVGAWAGDGSVAVMTRQRRRQAANTLMERVDNGGSCVETPLNVVHDNDRVVNQHPERKNQARNRHLMQRDVERYHQEKDDRQR